MAEKRKKKGPRAKTFKNKHVEMTLFFGARGGEGERRLLFVVTFLCIEQDSVKSCLEDG